MPDIVEADAAEQRAVAHAGPSEAPQRPLTVIEHAMRSGASAEQLERLLELQVRADNHQLELMRERRRMDEEDRKAAAVLAFRRDFAAFRGENIVVGKNKFVDRGKAGSFWQADYSEAAHLLSPALSKHGFSFRHDQRFGPKPWPLPDNPNNTVGWVWVTCYLEHKDGHVESLSLEGPEGDLHANTPVQNMQATASYLKRQSLLAITGTATGGEDDENQLRRKQQQRPADESADELDKVLAEGRDQSLGGMKSLNTWWAGLTVRQRTQLSPEYPGLRKAAQTADQKGANP